MVFVAQVESLYAFLAKVEAMVAKGEQACMMLQVRPGVTRQLPAANVL